MEISCYGKCNKRTAIGNDAMAAGLDETSGPWYSGISRYQWLVLLIASLGWIFDVFEGQLFVVTSNRALADLLGEQATRETIAYYNKLALAAFLVGGAVGGVGFGVLGDRIGRVKTMILTILMYAGFTGLTAFAQSCWHLVALRFLVATGVGGEWAVASAMVAEVFPKRARAWSLGLFHASSVLGIYVAVAVGTFIGANPSLGWRWCYAAGVLPALLTAWIYASLREPEAWLAARQAARQGAARPTGRILDLFAPEWRRGAWVGLALATIGLATFWGVYIEGWKLIREETENRHLDPEVALARGPVRQKALDQLPESVRKSIDRTEMLAMFLVVTGGGIGLVSFGPLANRLGRRGAFLLFCLGGMAAAVLMFQVLPHGPAWVRWTALPVFGYFATGMHAGYAIYFPELFPTRLRGTGSSFCFNGGRLLASPILILTGWMQRDLAMSLTDSATLLGLLFLLGIVVLAAAPETRGKELPA